jgi:RNA polymerase sigma factor (sigma-70 family)
MADYEQRTKAVVDEFALLIKKIIQKNLHRSDGLDLEDIEQEVRLKIWIFLKKGKKVRKLPSYIKKVAYSTTIDELRKAMKQGPSRQPEEMKRIYSASCLVANPVRDFRPEDRLEEGEARDAVWSMVNTLSDNRKRVLKLYLLGQSLEEIGASLKWERSKVRHFFYRGIDDLKHKFGPPAARGGDRVSHGRHPEVRL